MRWISFILFTWYLRLLATRRTAKETLAKTALKGEKKKRILRIKSDNNDNKTKKRKNEKWKRDDEKNRKGKSEKTRKNKNWRWWWKIVSMHVFTYVRTFGMYLVWGIGVAWIQGPFWWSLAWTCCPYHSYCSHCWKDEIRLD